mgnify:FL=1
MYCFVYKSGNQEAIERQQRALWTVVDEIEKAKVTKAAEMIEEKRSLEEIGTWNSGIEEKLTEAENHSRSFQEWCDCKKREC